MTLEDLQPRCAVRGVHPDGVVTVVSVQWFGSEALELTYKTPTETVANELLYRHDEARLEVVAAGQPWRFDGDGALFRLVSEAQRIRLAYLSRKLGRTVAGRALPTVSAPVRDPHQRQACSSARHSAGSAERRGNASPAATR